MSLPSRVSRFYENEIPSFVENELENLYGSIFSSMAQFRVYGGAEQASAYAAWENEQLRALFLYTLEGQTLRIMNEGMTLEENDVKQFAREAFDRYPHISIIGFHSVQPAFAGLPLPGHRFFSAEDIALALPDSVDAYRASLSKSTRQHLNYYQNRLKRRYPDFQFEVSTRDDIREDDIRAIVAFNRLRMAGKNKVSTVDDAELQRIIRLSREKGMVCTIRLNGKICAGSVRYHVGTTFFARLNAHDPAYDEDRIGTLCAYLTICECIRRGGRKFSFDHGRNENKYRFLAKDVKLEKLIIYRSYLHLILNGRFALNTAASGYAAELKRTLLHAANEKAWAARTVGMLRLLARNIRHIRSA